MLMTHTKAVFNSGWVFTSEYGVKAKLKDFF